MLILRSNGDEKCKKSRDQTCVCDSGDLTRFLGRPCGFDILECANWTITLHPTLLLRLAFPNMESVPKSTLPPGLPVCSISTVQPSHRPDSELVNLAAAFRTFTYKEVQMTLRCKNMIMKYKFYCEFSPMMFALSVPRSP